MLRDEIAFATLPPLPNIYFAWNPNNAGPMYFLVCLTLGVVVPALRCAFILGFGVLGV
jgi:hypothetical protein